MPRQLTFGDHKPMTIGGRHRLYAGGKRIKRADPDDAAEIAFRRKQGFELTERPIGQAP